MDSQTKRVHVAVWFIYLGLKVGIWEPLGTLSIYHIPTWAFCESIESVYKVGFRVSGLYPKPYTLNVRLTSKFENQKDSVSRL